MTSPFGRCGQQPRCHRRRNRPAFRSFLSVLGGVVVFLFSGAGLRASCSARMDRKVFSLLGRKAVMTQTVAGKGRDAATTKLETGTLEKGRARFDAVRHPMQQTFEDQTELDQIESLVRPAGEISARTGHLRSKVKDMNLNPIPHNFTMTTTTSSISDTEFEQLQTEIKESRKRANISGPDEPLTARELQDLKQAMSSDSSMLEYLAKSSYFHRQKVYAYLPDDVSERVRKIFRRCMIERKHLNKPRNHGKIRRTDKIIPFSEVKKQMQALGLPTDKISRTILGHGRYLHPRNKYVDAFPYDLSERKNDSDAMLQQKKIIRDKVIKRGLLKDTIGIDLRKEHKAKLMKQLGGELSEKEFRLRLKERKLLWKKQRAALRNGQRGTADRSIPMKRPRHMMGGKMKPWKNFRGRGY